MTGASPPNIAKLVEAVLTSALYPAPDTLRPTHDLLLVTLVNPLSFARLMTIRLTHIAAYRLSGQTITDLGNMAPPPSRRLYWKMGRASPLSTGRDACFTVRDANGQALALVLFRGGAWPRAAADVARRIAANNGKQQICCPRWIGVTHEAIRRSESLLD